MSDDAGTPAEPVDAPPNIQQEPVRMLSLVPRSVSAPGESSKTANEPTTDGSTAASASRPLPKSAVQIPNDPPPKVEDINLQDLLKDALLAITTSPPVDLEPIEYDDPNSPARKRGRPPYRVDPRLVYSMALNGSKQHEIAAFFGCSKDVIIKRFGDIFSRGVAARRMMLRQGQTMAAMDGNAAMLIWLGKQELKQIDESRVRIGNLANYSDEELEQIAKGRLPGQLKSSNRVKSVEDEE